MINPEGFVRYKDLQNIDRLIRKDLTSGNITINGLVIKPNGLIIGVPKVIQNLFLDADNKGNVGTGVDDLQSFTLPLNSLAADGDFLDVDYGGFYAANNDDKRTLALFDGTTYEDGNGAPQDQDGGSNNGWRFLNRITRKDSTHVIIQSFLAAEFIFMDSAAVLAAPGAAGYMQFNRNVVNLAVANLNNNNIVMKVQAESATATNNNIVQNISCIKLCQMS